MVAKYSQSRRTLVRQAFAASLPVLTGYATMGFAAGVLLALHGGLANPGVWAGASSAVLVSGPLQFLFVDWVKSGTAFADVAALVVCLNIRYSLYGLSLLERFGAARLPIRAYLIGTITDETYALQVQCPYPPGPDGTFYCLMLALFDHAYWVFGVTAGAVAGAALPFAAKGIDFAMTALFLVILTDLCRVRANRIPAAIGACAAVAAAVFMRVLFDSWKMLVPAMALAVATLLAIRRLFPNTDSKFQKERSHDEP